LELAVLFSEVNELCGANEGKVCGIEEENVPLASEICAANGLKLAIVEGFYLEFGCLCVDNGLHIVFVFVRFNRDFLEAV